MIVSSRDNTPIFADVSGSGPALVLVHGISSDRTRWTPVLPALRQHHTVYAVDRRGRGGSGDAPEYALEREFEDIAALCEAIGEPVALLGHSYGGLIAMEAALRSRNVARLIAYEPWFIGMRILKPGTLDRLQALLDAGDREGMLTTFFLDVIRASPEELAALRATPSWEPRLAIAPTILRELRAIETYRFDGLPFRQLSTPALLMLGELSMPAAGRMVWVAHEALPGSRVLTLPGQRHVAMDTAPELFAREILAFLTG